MAVATFTKSGNKAAEPARLDKKVFGLEVNNHELLKDAYLAFLADGRANLARTKKRGEVRGGGAKPWRQKGLGRARVGSSRNPLWRGGGVAFGPTGDEKYSRKLNVGSKRKALRQALSLAAQADRIKIIENFDCKEGRVKSTLALFEKIGAQGKILLVVNLKDELVARATRNLPGVKAVSANYLTVYDTLNADQIIITKEGLDLIQKWLGGEK